MSPKDTDVVKNKMALKEGQGPKGLFDDVNLSYPKLIDKIDKILKESLGKLETTGKKIEKKIADLEVEIKGAKGIHLGYIVAEVVLLKQCLKLLKRRIKELEARKLKLMEYFRELDDEKKEQDRKEIQKLYERMDDAKKEAELIAEQKALEAAIEAKKEFYELLSQRQELVEQRQQKIQENITIEKHIQYDKKLLEESWQRTVESGYIGNLGKKRGSSLSDQETEAVHEIYNDPNISEKDRPAAVAKVLRMSEKEVKEVENETSGFSSESQVRQSIVEDIKYSEKIYKENDVVIEHITNQIQQIDHQLESKKDLMATVGEVMRLHNVEPKIIANMMKQIDTEYENLSHQDKVNLLEGLGKGVGENAKGTMTKEERWSQFLHRKNGVIAESKQGEIAIPKEIGPIEDEGISKVDKVQLFTSLAAVQSERPLLDVKKDVDQGAKIELRLKEIEEKEKELRDKNLDIDDELEDAADDQEKEKLKSEKEENIKEWGKLKEEKESLGRELKTLGTKKTEQLGDSETNSTSARNKL